MASNKSFLTYDKAKVIHLLHETLDKYDAELAQIEREKADEKLELPAKVAELLAKVQDSYLSALNELVAVSASVPAVAHIQNDNRVVLVDEVAAARLKLFNISGSSEVALKYHQPNSLKMQISKLERLIYLLEQSETEKLSFSYDGLCQNVRGDTGLLNSILDLI